MIKVEFEILDIVFQNQKKNSFLFMFVERTFIQKWEQLKYQVQIKKNIILSYP